MISRDFFSVANNLGDSVAFNLESDNFEKGPKRSGSGCERTMEQRAGRGQLNRLKMLKRQMYGRAGIELLHARLLPEPAFSDP